MIAVPGGPELAGCAAGGELLPEISSWIAGGDTGAAFRVAGRGTWAAGLRTTLSRLALTVSARRS
jgi:hypothetical protein